MTLHQDLSLRRYYLWNQGQMDIFKLMLLKKINKNAELVEAYNYLTLGIRSLGSQERSNELYFRIWEGVEEKEGTSIDKSIILDYHCQSWWGRQKSIAIKAVFSSLIF